MSSGIVEWVLRVVNQASKPTDEAAASAKGLAKATAAATPATAELGKTSGKAAEGLARLGGALSIVSPQAGALIGEAGRAAGGLRTIAEGAEAAGLGLGSVGLAVGALAVVLGVGYGAWKQLHEEEDNDAEITKSIAEARKKLKPLFDAENQALVDLRIANGELTEEEGAALKRRMAAHQLLSDSLVSSQKEITDLYAGEGTLGRVLGDIAEENQKKWGGSYDFISMAIDGMTTSTEEATQQIGELSAGQTQLTADVKQANKTIDEGADKLGKYKDAAAGAAKKAADFAKDGAAAMSESIGNADTAGYLAGAKAEADMHRRLVDMMTERKRAEVEQLTGIDRIAAAEAEALRENAIALGRSLEDFKGTEEQKAALIQAYEDKATAIHEQGIRDRAKADADEAARKDAARRAGFAGWSSDPIGMLSNMPGPVGWVFGIAQAVTQIKQLNAGVTQWESDLVAGIRNGGSAIAKHSREGVSVATEIIKAVPHFVQGLIDGIPALIQSIAGEIGPLANALMDGLVTGVPKLVTSLLVALFDPQTWIKAGQSLYEGFARGTQEQSLKGVGTSGPKTLGNGFTDALANMFTNQSHADGARYADRTGYMMVHKGERIDTADQVQRGESGGQRTGGRGRMFGAGGRAYIEIDLDSLSDTLSQAGRRGYAFGAS